MSNKPGNKAENKKFDYYAVDNAAQKQESADPDHLVTSLRAEMLPGSEILPIEKENDKRISPKIAVEIILLVVISGYLIFLFAGPGRQLLEKRLVGLAGKENVPTQQATPTQIPIIIISPQASKTASPRPTLRPTNTQTMVVVPSSTFIPSSTASDVEPTSTITLIVETSPTCRDAVSITLADVGQQLCVQGVVIETISNPSNFMVIFSTEKGSLYWVSYDLVWTKGELKTCYQITGTIDKIANTPVLVFDYTNLPEECP